MTENEYEDDLEAKMSQIFGDESKENKAKENDTPNKLPYPVPEKRQNNEFHRVISPGKSENLKRRIEKAPEDNNIKKIKVEENCTSIDEENLTQLRFGQSMKNTVPFQNLTPNNFEQGISKMNVENQDIGQLKEDCKFEQFEKEGLILSKSDDKIGQLFQCGLCEKKWNVIWYNSKPTLMKHILKSHGNYSKVKTKFESKKDLVSKVSKNQLIFCLMCGDDFSDFEQLSKHIEIKIECRSSINEVQLKKKIRTKKAIGQ